MKLVTLTLSHDGAAKHLEEALRSAPWADSHLVLDTSPDKPGVKDAVAKIDRPIVVRDWAWRNDFSAARNHLFRQVETLVDGPTWAVILDSDERLVVPDAQAFRDELRACIPEVCYSAYIDDNYVKDRVFRIPTKANFLGPTHEACCGGEGRHTLKSLKFWELGKSAEELAHKRERDEQILEKHTKANPTDARWWYYYGDTLSCFPDKRKKAIKAFETCARLRGWDQEGAWACYRAAELRLGLEQYQEAVETCARGIAIHPGLAELYWIASVASWRKGDRDKATHWAQISIAMGLHKGVGSMVYRTGFRHVPALYELPYDVLRYSLPDEEQRRDAEQQFWEAKFARYGGSAEEVAVSRTNLNSAVRWEARNDIAKRSSKLSDLLDVTVRPIKILGTSYHSMNPSICVHKGRLTAIVRTVNYIEHEGNYTPAAEDNGVIKTENYLVDVDEGFGIVPIPNLYSSLSFDKSFTRLIVDKSGAETFPTLVRGYEDMRIVSVAGELWASATVRDHKASCPCEIAVCKLSEDGEITKVYVQPSARTEKNWMPLDIDGSLAFLYTVDPTVVRKFDPDTGLCDEAIVSTPGLALDHLRGGSGVVAVGDGTFLCVTHEVAWVNDKRAYLHRFVRLDKDFRVTSVSRAWHLENVGIEFVSGMCLWNEKIIIGAGLRDHDACFVVADKEDVLSLSEQFSEAT